MVLFDHEETEGVHVLVGVYGECGWPPCVPFAVCRAIGTPAHVPFGVYGERGARADMSTRGEYLENEKINKQICDIKDIY